MIKRTPSRNARTRGFKVKNVLQICLLLGVCFWLIYQVKHSHDKKKEFDEKESKISVKTQSGDGISNLGRKGLHPRVPELPKDEKHEEDDDEGTILEEEVNKMEEYKREQKQVEDETKHEEEEEREEEGTKHEEEEREEGSKHEEEEREEEEEGSKHDMEEREEERNKLEDEEQEEETKNDETEDERRGGGTDEIDEPDQEKIGEADLEEDFVDEGKEREEEGEEKESGHDEAGDKEAQVDDETSMEDQDHDEGVQNDHEAREEHYKADDASSAVHDTQTISTEPEKVSSENLEANDLELEKNSNNNNTNDVNGDKKNSKSQLGEGVTAENDSQLNMKGGEKMDDEIINTKDQSTKNATIVPVSNGQPELSNNSMDVNTEAGNETSSSSQHNEIGVTSDSNQAQNAKIATEEASNLKTNELEQVNSNTIADRGETDSNSSVPDKTENIDNSAKDSNSSTNSEPSGSDKLIKDEVKAEAEVKPDGSDKVTKPEVKADAEVNSGSSSTTKETADTAIDGNSDAKNELGGTEKNKGSSATDGTEAVFHDHIDSSDSSVGQEEARINLDTLPENSGDGINSRDVAAE